MIGGEIPPLLTNQNHKSIIREVNTKLCNIKHTLNKRIYYYQQGEGCCILAYVALSFLVVKNKYMKETFYFSHDYNAIQDPKLMALLNCCGLEGIGIYWILIELLHQQPESRMLYKSYEDYIEFYGRIDGENEQRLNNIKQMLINIGLFTKDDEFIYSERVLKNKKERERISKLRSYAGKKSAESRAKSTSVEQVLNKTQHNKGKERKGKEKKDIKSRFTPPLLEEVKKYIQERNNGVDPERWYDFYSAKGWMIGKNKMKDWKAAVRTWEDKKDNKNKYSC